MRIKLDYSFLPYENLEISYHNLNLLLLTTGIAIVIYLISEKRAKKRAITFSNYELLKKIAGKHAQVKKNLIPLAIRLTIISVIIFAITDFTVSFTGYRAKADIVTAFDISPSMLSSDILPDRLEASKNALLPVIEKMPKGAKMGIVTFAGEVHQLSELTTNQEELESKVQNITYGKRAGTAIGDALIASSALFKDSKNNRLILLTDGSNNVGSAIEEGLKTLENKNVTVFALGLGKNQTNETVELPPEIKEKIGNVTQITGYQQTGINQTRLKTLANETGGKYFRVTNRTDISNLMEEISLEKQKVTLRPTFYLLTIAIILLMIEWSLGATKYRTLP